MGPQKKLDPSRNYSSHLLWYPFMGDLRWLFSMAGLFPLVSINSTHVSMVPLIHPNPPIKKNWTTKIVVRFLTNRFKHLRVSFRDLRNTLPEIVHVLGLLLFVMVFYTLFVVVFFRGSWVFVTSSNLESCRELITNTFFRENGARFFPNFGRGFLSMYVLYTTANFPDVMYVLLLENDFYFSDCTQL